MSDANSNEDVMMDLNLDSLDAEAYLQIARDVERFEQAWSDGTPFPLEDLFHDRPEALHGELLRHALIVELAYRRDRGETPTIGSYDWRFPLHVHVIEQAFAEGVAARMAPPPPVPAAAPAPFPPKLGKFIVLRRLGDGGQGSAFLARDPDLGHQVVLKRYHGGMSASALKDGEHLCGIRSRYVPQCFGMERDGDQLYVVMEYIPGRSLAEVRSETSPKARHGGTVDRASCRGARGSPCPRAAAPRPEALEHRHRGRPAPPAGRLRHRGPPGEPGAARHLGDGSLHGPRAGAQRLRQH
jgi:hypothetical protein